MYGMLEGWKVGKWVILGMCLSNIPTFQLSAQVGHNPGDSPYHDIPVHPGPMVFLGHLSGDRGSAGSGFSNARTYGLRYELPAGRSMIFQFTSVYLKGDQFVVNPFVDTNAVGRKTGPFPATLVMGEIGMQLRLSGGKSWRGFAPYVGTALGLVSATKQPKDTSAYRFGTKLTPSFATGVRWYPARHLQINVDLRAQLWRLKYPVAYHDAAPDGSRVIALNKTLQDWTLHPWISLGVGWIF